MELSKHQLVLFLLVANGTICLWIIKNTDVSKSSMLVLLLSSITMIGVLTTNNIVTFIIMNVIFFALNSIIIPLIQDLIVKYTTNKNNSIVMGFYNAIKSLGGIIGALLAGFFLYF